MDSTRAEKKWSRVARTRTMRKSDVINAGLLRAEDIYYGIVPCQVSPPVLDLNVNQDSLIDLLKPTFQAHS